MSSKLQNSKLVGIIFISGLITCASLLNSCQAGSSAQNAGLASSAEPITETRDEITEPPAMLNLDTFYKKYLSASGIPVISSAKVPDAALYAVQRTINTMMKMRPDVLTKMIENKARVGIMAKLATGCEKMTGLPTATSVHEWAVVTVSCTVCVTLLMVLLVKV